MQRDGMLSRIRAGGPLPPLRLDLRFVRDKQTQRFKLSDPATGKFVELYELECLIAQAMDGQQTSEDLTTFARMYNPSITTQEIEQLIVQLADRGLLQDAQQQASEPVDEFDGLRDTLLRHTSQGDVVDEPPAAAPPPPVEATPEAPPAQPQQTPQTSEVEQAELWHDTHEKVRWYQRTSLRLLLALGVIVGALYFIHYPLHVTAECAIVPTNRVYVRAQMQGVLAQILVDEGTQVKKGDVLARLDDRDLAADQRKAIAEVERISADLARVKKGARPEEIQQQRATLAGRRTAVAFAYKEAQRRAAMVRDGVGSKQSVDEANLDLQIKQKAADEAAAALKLLEAGSRPEEVAALEAALKRAEAERDYVSEKLEDMVVIRAPMDGVVLTPKFRERLHEKVDAGGLVCEIADTSKMHAEILVPEREADSVQVGMPVVVKVESYPRHPFEGKVDFIAPAVEVRDKTNVLRVTVTLDNSEGLLRQDMTGYGEVDCGSHSLLDLSTRRLFRWIRVRFLI